jgi:hypothetical protein
MLTSVFKFTLSFPKLTVLRNMISIARKIRGFHTQIITDNLYATALKVIYCPWWQLSKRKWRTAGNFSKSSKK